MIYRLDTGKLSSPRRLADGRFVADALLTRVGVFVYQNPDGSERNELRHPDDVFDATSVASANMLPFTNEHPDTRVNGENAHKHMVGSTGETARRLNDNLANTIMVADGPTVKQIEGGKVELSCGYSAGFDPTPGVYNGIRYDGRQTNIVYNHVALVEQGRAGPDIRILMDKADALVQVERVDSAKDDFPMEELKEALKEIAALQVRVDKAESKAKEETERADAAEAKADTAKSELETEKAESTKRADKADADRKDSIDLRVSVKPILGKEYKADATDKELRLAVITKVYNMDASEKSDGYIEVRFEDAVKAATKDGEAIDEVRRVADGGATGASGDLEAEAKKRMDDRRNKKGE